MPSEPPAHPLSPAPLEEFTREELQALRCKAYRCSARNPTALNLQERLGLAADVLDAFLARDLLDAQKK